MITTRCHKLAKIIYPQSRFCSGPSHKVILVVGGRKGIGNGLVEHLETKAKQSKTKLDIISTSSQFNSTDTSSNEGVNKHFIPLDINNKATLQEAAEYIDEKFPKLDMLINCIGILHGQINNKEYLPEKSITDIDAEWMQENFRVNSISTALLAKYFCNVLGKSVSGDEHHAIFATLSARIGSIGDNKLGGWYSYRMSKAAEHQFIKTLSIELQRKSSNPKFRKVLAVCLHPGTVDTDLSAPFKKGVKSDKLFTPLYSAEKLVSVLDSVTAKDTGKIFAWDGEEIPY